MECNCFTGETNRCSIHGWPSRQTQHQVEIMLNVGSLSVEQLRALEIQVSDEMKRRGMIMLTATDVRELHKAGQCVDLCGTPFRDDPCENPDHQKILAGER